MLIGQLGAVVGSLGQVFSTLNVPFRASLINTYSKLKREQVPKAGTQSRAIKQAPQRGQRGATTSSAPSLVQDAGGCS